DVLTAASSRDHQPPVDEGRIGLRVTAPTQRHQHVEIPIGAAPGPLDHMVNVEPSAPAAGPAAPASAGQHGCPNDQPLVRRGGWAAMRARLIGATPTPRRTTERLTSNHQAPARSTLFTPARSTKLRATRVCPRGQNRWA